MPKNQAELWKKKCLPAFTYSLNLSATYQHEPERAKAELVKVSLPQDRQKQEFQDTLLNQLLNFVHPSEDTEIKYVDYMFI